MDKAGRRETILEVTQPYGQREGDVSVLIMALYHKRKQVSSD